MRIYAKYCEICACNTAYISIYGVYLTYRRIYIYTYTSHTYLYGVYVFIRRTSYVTQNERYEQPWYVPTDRSAVFRLISHALRLCGMSSLLTYAHPHQRDYFGWIGWFNPVDLLGDPVEICTLSLIWGKSSLISSGFDFQSGGFL